MDEQTKSTQEIDEAVLRVKAKVDQSAERLKDKLGGTVMQIEGVIDGADQIVNRVIDRVNVTATQTRDVLKSAEKVAEHLEDPVGMVRQFPIAALTGAVVGGMVLGMLIKRERQSAQGAGLTRRFKVAP